MASMAELQSENHCHNNLSHICHKTSDSRENIVWTDETKV